MSCSSASCPGGRFVRQALISCSYYNPVGLCFQHQDWITLTYIVNVYRFVYHVMRCKTILKRRVTSPDNCTKANGGTSGLAEGRRVDAAFCLSSRSWDFLPAQIKCELLIFLIYRPVVPTYHSLMSSPLRSDTRTCVKQSSGGGQIKLLLWLQTADDIRLLLF